MQGDAPSHPELLDALAVDQAQLALLLPEGVGRALGHGDLDRARQDARDPRGPHPTHRFHALAHHVEVDVADLLAVLDTRGDDDLLGLQALDAGHVDLVDRQSRQVRDAGHHGRRGLRDRRERARCPHPQAADGDDGAAHDGADPADALHAAAVDERGGLRLAVGHLRPAATLDLLAALRHGHVADAGHDASRVQRRHDASSTIHTTRSSNDMPS